jgi:Zn-dependent peptidase ImmA (M78 family)/DNA-binding XRE family transcriptional regulator
MTGERFYGARLRLARVFNGLSPADLAEKSGVTRQYIHSLEIDERAPSGDLLRALAFLLHVSPRFFSRPISASVADEYFHFRSRRSAPAFARQECVARGSLFDELITELDSALRLPKVDIQPMEAETATEIEGVAAIYRKRWELGDGPISNMCRVIEQRAGAVITYFSVVSEKVDAFSISRPRPVVVRNPAKESPGRMRFDLAHELGHLILHHGIETGDDLTEKQADIFASAFLLPRNSFIAEFPRASPLDWDALYRLKLRWKVSVAAILYRAHDLQLLDPAQYRIANIRLAKTRQKKKEWYDDQLQVEKPELLEMALDKYEDLPNKSITAFAEELGVTPLFVRRLAGLTPISAEAWENDPSIVRLDDYRKNIQSIK